MCNFHLAFFICLSNSRQRLRVSLSERWFLWLVVMVNLIEIFSWVSYILNKIHVECKSAWCSGGAAAALMSSMSKATNAQTARLLPPFLPSYRPSILPTVLPSFRPSYRPSFLPQPNPHSRDLCDLGCGWPPGWGTTARGPVTRDTPPPSPQQVSPHRPAPSVSEDLQQKIYSSCLYPPVGIKDWSIWMWATISSFTCQKWLREFISELCLPLSLTELHFLWGTFKSYSD